MVICVCCEIILCLNWTFWPNGGSKGKVGGLIEKEEAKTGIHPLETAICAMDVMEI